MRDRLEDLCPLKTIECMAKHADVEFMISISGSVANASLFFSGLVFIAACAFFVWAALK